MNRLVLTVMVCAFIAGCAGRQPTWSTAGGKQVIEPERIEVTWPQTWMKLVPAESDEKAKKEGLLLLVTRDGVGLQIIALKKRRLDDVFPHTEKKASPDMRIHELAELVMDDIRADPNVMDLELIENSPAQLGGVPGFKLIFGYRNKGGLRKQAVIYGCVENGHLYRLVYEAPRRHYFHTDLPTFEAVKDSFAWKDKPGT